MQHADRTEDLESEFEQPVPRPAGVSIFLGKDDGVDRDAGYKAIHKDCVNPRKPRGMKRKR